MLEAWNDVVGYEGIYKVSITGKVKSLHGKEKYLSQSISKGYKVVALSKNGKAKMMKVHRLVAMAFIPNPMNKPHVNHIDSNRANAHVYNLEWCTPRENSQHALKYNKKSEDVFEHCEIIGGIRFY
jgi:hypothetical protein